MYHGIKIPTNYKQTGEWNHTAAAPQHGATYGSRIYKSVGHASNFGRSLDKWLMCLSYGWKLHWLLRHAPWGNKAHAIETTEHSLACITTDWERTNDFLVATFEWAVVVVNLATGEIESVYFRGAKHTESRPFEQMEQLDKKRQIEQGTWPQPAAAGITRSTYQYNKLFTGQWSDGTTATA